jgi:hypothetical protein
MMAQQVLDFRSGEVIHFDVHFLVYLANSSGNQVLIKVLA